MAFFTLKVTKFPFDGIKKMFLASAKDSLSLHSEKLSAQFYKQTDKYHTLATKIELFDSDVHFKNIVEASAEKLTGKIWVKQTGERQARLNGDIDLEKFKFQAKDSIRSFIQNAEVKAQVFPKEENKNTYITSQFTIDSVAVSQQKAFVAIQQGNYDIELTRNAPKKWSPKGSVSFKNLMAYDPKFVHRLKMPASKIEFEKANNFLEEAKKDEKKIKKSLSLNKDKKKKKSIFKKNKDPILEEDLEKIEIYNKETFKKEFLEYAPEVIEFFGKSSNVVSRAKKAGRYMSKEFGRSEEGQQRFPGRMIKAMAAFEIFYIDALRKSRKNLIRYKEKKDTKYRFKSMDETKVRSLISMNQGMEKMRKALGMDLQTPRAEAIKKFWYLGEFLSLGKVLKNSEHDPKLEKRKKLLIEYKQKITQLKNKIEEEQKKVGIN